MIIIDCDRGSKKSARRSKLFAGYRGGLIITVWSEFNHITEGCFCCDALHFIEKTLLLREIYKGRKLALALSISESRASDNRHSLL